MAGETTAAVSDAPPANETAAIVNDAPPAADPSPAATDAPAMETAPAADAVPVPGPPAAEPLQPKLFDIVVRGNVRFGATVYERGQILAQIALLPGAPFGVQFITDMIAAGRLLVKKAD